MRAFLKKILSPLLQKASAIYLSKPRKYRYKDLSVLIEPTVFPPFLTISTKLLLEFIAPLSLKGKTFLELGCGSGIISILAARNGAQVTATDINPIAISALVKNAASNHVVIDILSSDLFENLMDKSFDYIIINPPYYPKNPISIAEKAWFCGEQFDYFEQLFFQLPHFKTSDNNIIMILSEDCDLQKIKTIALNNKMAFKVLLAKKVAGEKNYIFEIDKL